MSTSYGGYVPYPLAESELNQYQAQFANESYYRESITYTISELRAYLDQAKLDLEKIGVLDVDQQCISLLPCISDTDQRLDVLFVPSYVAPLSTNQNGIVKHRFNILLGQRQGNPGLPDTDNLYRNFGDEDLEDAYDTGLGKP